MIAKNEACDVNDARVRTITEKRKFLEKNSTEIRERVTKCFDQLSNSLKIRERQLLRQIEAVHNQQLSIIQSNWELLPSVPSININLDYRKNLEDTILKFGRIELPDKEGIVVKDAEPYKVEEYVEADKDHVSFDKSIKLDDTNLVINLSKKFSLCTIDNARDSPNGSTDGYNTNPQIGYFMHTGNNNCSILCSSLLESSLDATYDSECNLRLDNSSKSLCSSNTINSINQGTIVEAALNDEHLISDDDKKIDGVAKKNIERKIEGIVDMDNSILNSNKTLESPNNNGNNEHPEQIQQWLEEILVETETEPVVHEAEQFVEISKSRYREFEFPLKT